MNIEQLQNDLLVTDKERQAHGIGKIERTKDGITYVWYDEIETMVHYQESELQLLELLD